MAGRILSLAVATVVASVALPGAQGPPLAAGGLKGLEFRSIGPTLTTGRTQDIEIAPQPQCLVHREGFRRTLENRNRGITFSPIFDCGSAITLCCVVVDPRDRNMVSLGTDENTSQRSAHSGDRVHKSTDGRKT